MRLFAAVIPPPEAVRHLDDAVRQVRAGQPALTWTGVEAWHLTLAFYGEVTDDVLPELQSRLARAAQRHPVMDLGFAGAGRFNGRVLWIAVVGDRLELRRLADSSAAAGRRCGIAVEERPYRPHLTLARARSTVDLRPQVAALQDYAGPQWPADRLVLVRSQLGAGPGRRAKYTEVAAWPLGGGSTEGRSVGNRSDRGSDEGTHDDGKDE